MMNKAKFATLAATGLLLFSPIQTKLRAQETNQQSTIPTVPAEQTPTIVVNVFHPNVETYHSKYNHGPRLHETGLVDNDVTCYVEYTTKTQRSVECDEIILLSKNGKPALIFKTENGKLVSYSEIFSDKGNTSTNTYDIVDSKSELSNKRREHPGEYLDLGDHEFDYVGDSSGNVITRKFLRLRNDPEGKYWMKWANAIEMGVIKPQNLIRD
jgi:hypothetical protein